MGGMSMTRTMKGTDVLTDLKGALECVACEESRNRQVFSFVVGICTIAWGSDWCRVRISVGIFVGFETRRWHSREKIRLPNAVLLPQHSQSFLQNNY
jgi:hypothetical protein